MPIQLLRRFSNAYTIITILLLSIFSISANFLSYTSVIIHINNQLDYLLETIRQIEDFRTFIQLLRFSSPQFSLLGHIHASTRPSGFSLTPFQHSSGLKTMTQAGSGQLGQRWRHNCAMFNSKLQETIKRATPVGVMGAECRRNVATPRGNHSLSRRAGAHSSSLDAPGPGFGCSR